MQKSDAFGLLRPLSFPIDQLNRYYDFPISPGLSKPTITLHIANDAFSEGSWDPLSTDTQKFIWFHSQPDSVVWWVKI